LIICIYAILLIFFRIIGILANFLTYAINYITVE
jgi:hypothetical protein